MSLLAAVYIVISSTMIPTNMEIFFTPFSSSLLLESKTCDAYKSMDLLTNLGKNLRGMVRVCGSGQGATFEIL